MNNPTDRDQQRNESPRIYTKCPACGNDTLTINDDKHLLCTWINCPDPTAIDNLSQGNEDTAIVDWFGTNFYAAQDKLRDITTLQATSPRFFRGDILAARGVQPAAKETGVWSGAMEATYCPACDVDTRDAHHLSSCPAAQQESAPAAEQHRWDWEERVTEFHILCNGQTLFRVKDEWTAKTCVQEHNATLAAPSPAQSAPTAEQLINETGIANFQKHAAQQESAQDRLACRDYANEPHTCLPKKQESAPAAEQVIRAAKELRDSGYDGPFSGDAVVPLFTALADYEKSSPTQDKPVAASVEEARVTSTPTTDFLARDGWSGDAVCVSWRDMARIETAFRTLIASVRHAHVDGDGLIRGCAVCTALANSERALSASSPSEQKSSLPASAATPKEK